MSKRRQRHDDSDDDDDFDIEELEGPKRHQSTYNIREVNDIGRIINELPAGEEGVENVVQLCQSNPTFSNWCSQNGAYQYLLKKVGIYLDSYGTPLEQLQAYFDGQRSHMVFTFDDTDAPFAPSIPGFPDIPYRIKGGDEMGEIRPYIGDFPDDWTYDWMKEISEKRKIVFPVPGFLPKRGQAGWIAGSIEPTITNPQVPYRLFKTQYEALRYLQDPKVVDIFGNYSDFGAYMRRFDAVQLLRDGVMVGDFTPAGQPPLSGDVLFLILQPIKIL